MAELGIFKITEALTTACVEKGAVQIGEKTSTSLAIKNGFKICFDAALKTIVQKANTQSSLFIRHQSQCKRRSYSD